MNDESFYSINRLVEFGMSLTIAQQMVQTMNSAITNMHVPGTINTMSSQFYYAIINNNQAGPFSEQELARLIAENKIVKDTFVWKPGLSKWQLAENIPEVLKLVALTPPLFQPLV